MKTNEIQEKRRSKKVIKTTQSENTEQKFHFSFARKIFISSFDFDFKIKIFIVIAVLFNRI